jgi:hypothetical protein
VIEFTTEPLAPADIAGNDQLGAVIQDFILDWIARRSWAIHNDENVQWHNIYADMDQEFLDHIMANPEFGTSVIMYLIHMMSTARAEMEDE